MNQWKNSRLIFVGQAPSRSGTPGSILEGSIGRFLAGLMDVSFEEYLRRTERMNLLQEWLGKVGKGDAWDRVAAIKNAEEVKKVLSGRKAVLLGRNVSEAFFRRPPDWMTWTELNGGAVASVPHPSGIVLWWNSEENRALASKFLKEALELC